MHLSTLHEYRLFFNTEMAIRQTCGLAKIAVGKRLDKEAVISSIFVGWIEINGFWDGGSCVCFDLNNIWYYDRVEV
jgi:hypothetical protein